ncbi:UNVERIFIED_CONTAM: hypothetical protein Slati_4293300 [Sesamum latifolium]|uniref:Uncharacterized protein n=1 Tax=Sesamum latifolium TaxID=2727402 RepID=A0AAW2TDS6_9LAMI
MPTTGHRCCKCPAVAINTIALKKDPPTEWTVVQRRSKNNSKHQQPAEIEQQLETPPADNDK